MNAVGTFVALAVRTLPPRGSSTGAGGCPSFLIALSWSWVTEAGFHRTDQIGVGQEEREAEGAGGEDRGKEGGEEGGEEGEE